jgi:MFS family permease
LLNAGVVNVALDLHRTPTAIAQLSGYMLLCTGAVGPFVSAIGRKYGKRPVYVASSIFGMIGILISESASGYSTLLAGRILQGVGIAAYEALVIATIGDLFFVHERGPRVAVAMFMLAAISNGVSIIAGVITANLGTLLSRSLQIPADNGLPQAGGSTSTYAYHLELCKRS